MRKDVSSEVHCGECPFFKNEDIDGYGHCNIGKREGHCSDLCRYFTYIMSRKETLRLLHYCQKWRQGANITMPPPALFGWAIDNAMRIIRNLSKNNNEAE